MMGLMLLLLLLELRRWHLGWLLANGPRRIFDSSARVVRVLHSNVAVAVAHLRRRRQHRAAGNGRCLLLEVRGLRSQSISSREATRAVGSIRSRPGSGAAAVGLLLPLMLHGLLSRTDGL
jgi:hypothetical protein